MAECSELRLTWILRCCRRWSLVLRRHDRAGSVRVYLACGVTDMRRGIDGLSALVETVVKEAPGSGAIFGFRGKRADRIKLLWWDGQGFCL
ncbi:IS66 family insertion sequence element accessory protein TnpB, partial [Rhizobium lentis]|uniref:IS66 family insertion sequence element accessory protein TnpB n=1 Tax=Rhizobium lentis TaxID=1138194 RepID=UPI0016082682